MPGFRRLACGTAAALLLTLFPSNARAQAGAERARSGETLAVVPGPQYDAGWLHRLLFGDHYRDLWTAPREARVLNLRYGLSDGIEWTLEDVGHEFTVTRERIRQIEAHALRRMRHPTRARRLEVFSQH